MRRIRLRELKPELREEVLVLAREMHYERTVKASSSLSFLFRLYQEEKAKKRRSRKLLKKAEHLILKVAGLHHDSSGHAGPDRGGKGESRKKGRVVKSED
ncbi:MAG TPA: hypothetical protein EYP90_11435, partial [Chromatiaceae bacterium]|nr:hypothetical protein [Chromatiaceae bacterium]